MMKNNTRNRAMLLLLLCVFVAPGLCAYLFYLNPQWVNSQTTNKGRFVTPPILLPDLGSQKKWHMILWSGSHCDKTCITQMDQLARVRLAMGRRLYDIQSWLLLDEHAPLLSKKDQKRLSDEAIIVKRLSSHAAYPLKAAYPERQIFIANSDNYLILAFEPSANPADIFHDMKQLLTTAGK